MVDTIHDFGKLLWDIAGILRQEGLPSWQYVEEFSYFLFLKLFDEKEIEREKSKYRWKRIRANNT